MTNKLLFIHFEDLNGFLPFSLNLSNDFDISFDGNLLSIKPQENKFKAILGDNITDINMIAGENGIGKTTILRRVAAIINTPEDADVSEDYNYLLVYQLADGKLRVFNSLSRGHIYDAGNGAPHLEDSNEVSAPRKPLVYYSPYLDFNILDVGSRDEEVPIIDVSQTSILLKDLEQNKDNEENEHDIYAHKIKNIIRQIRLVKDKKRKLDIPFALPKQIDIKFNRLRINRDDVPIWGRSVFDHVQKLCAAKFRGYPENNLSLADFAKLMFLRNLMGLYFISVNSDKSQAALRDHAPKKVIDEVMDFPEEDGDTAGLMKLIIKFLKKENYFNAAIYTDFASVVFKAIEKEHVQVVLGHGRDNVHLRVGTESVFVDKLIGYLDLSSNHKLYHSYTMENIFKFISMEWMNVSSGEKGFLDIFSRLEVAKQQLPETKDTIILCIDEGEMGFHPSWQIKYLWFLRQYLTKSFKDYRLQLLLATHSPLVLSDLPKERVHLFKRTTVEGKTVRQKVTTFGTLAQNVSVLLTQDFFLENTLIGELAKEYIDSIIKRMRSSENSRSLIDDNNLASDIELIDEPVIKKLLLNELTRKRNA